MLSSRKIVLGLTATAMAGMLAVAPAEAGVMQAPTVESASQGALVQNVDWKHRGDWPRHRYHGGNNNNWVGPLIGGMVLGGILAAPSYGYGYGYQPYYAPAPRYRYSGYGNGHDAYCHSRFRSYNSATGLYFGYDGRYHRC